ncbi:MAG: hypothetical protein ACK5JG_21495, partial [Pseudomonadota bacterium]
PGGGPAPADAAGELPLVFVDVPAPGPRDTTGASGGAYLLDALRYIRLRAGAGVPVLVNVSLGALAGPHDGSSLTEQAIDAFLDADRAMAVTVAAGNAALERWHVRGTARRGRAVVLGWRLRPDDPTDSFTELWFDTGAAAPGTTVRLDTPDGRHCRIELPSGASAAAGEALIHGSDGTPVAALLARPAGAVGRGALVLVAVAPCAGARSAARHGLWRITVESRRDVPVAAWVQRDEQVGAAGGAGGVARAGRGHVDEHQRQLARRVGGRGAAARRARHRAAAGHHVEHVGAVRRVAQPPALVEQQVQLAVQHGLVGAGGDPREQRVDRGPVELAPVAQAGRSDPGLARGGAALLPYAEQPRAAGIGAAERARQQRAAAGDDGQHERRVGRAGGGGGARGRGARVR